MLNKRLLLALVITVCGVLFSLQAAGSQGIRVCNETGEKLYLTVRWQLPGKNSFDYFTRESFVKNGGIGVFSSKCRVFGPVARLDAFSWFTEAQWNALSADKRKILMDSSKEDLLPYAPKSQELKDWYRPDFDQSDLRSIVLQKGKKGKITVKEEKKWSLNPLKATIFKKLNPFNSEDEDL